MINAIITKNGANMYKKILSVILMSSFLCANEMGEYGWNVPNSSLNIGGYLDMTYDDNRENKFLFNDIAVLFSSSHERFNFLSEIELSYISLDGKSNNSSDVDLNVERLQLSYVLNDNQSFQIGRFESDIGYWNQAPILIVQDTTTKPHIVGNFFPKATTGVLYRYRLNEEHAFSFTFQDNEDLSHQDNSITVNRHKGLAYHGTKNDLSWRFSLGEYKEDNSLEANYVGIGSQYDVDEFTLQAELFMQNSEISEEKPYSGYVQSTWHVKEKHDAVVRFESYEDHVLDVKEEIYLLGYIYRPNNNMAIKGEYIYHTELPLNRFVYSISVLF